MEDKYSLNIGMWNSVFAVPTELCDSELRMAGAAQLKVMLYLLRHCGECVGIERLARAAGLSEGDAADAIAYWTGRGLIKAAGGELTPAERERADNARAEGSQTQEPETRDNMPVRSVPAEDGPVIEAAREQEAPAAEDAQEERKPRRREKMRYSYQEAAEMAAEDPDLNQMLLLVESLLRRQLNNSETSTLVTLVKWYGLPSTCVAMLVEYCMSIGYDNMAYIEQTGIGWSKEEILTVEQADAKIRRLRVRRTAWERVRRLLEIPERKPSDNELKMSELWVSEWQQNDDLIKLAYDRCVDRKGKMSFSYMNGILKRWKESGLETAEAVLASENREKAAGRSSAPSGERYGPTYDINEIKQQLDLEWFGSSDGEDA